MSQYYFEEITQNLVYPLHAFEVRKVLTKTSTNQLAHPEKKL